MDMKDNHINYIELKSKDIEKTKDFFSNAFHWKFTDYGSTYVSFSESGLKGGFELTNDKIVNGALIVLYYKNLEEIKDSIVKFGGEISKDIFFFPGGHRFHFTDPSGNELAVWSDN
ncbi:MAG: VOC family protein [Lutibacter sp.]|uniref:VOC family protein n=1 Tax=Lutibacter sp. TaxID=1925666 RepID=UPI00385844B3